MTNRTDTLRIDAWDAAARVASRVHAFRTADRMERRADAIAGRFSDDRRTFLGFGPLQLVALVAGTVLVAVIAFPFMGTTCGTVVENGTRMAAACMSEQDMRDTMDRIASERSGRTWEDGR